jgi:hypothetical protein
MAEVREIDGQMVLVDPEGAAVVKAINKLNCNNTLAMNDERVRHFKQRIIDLGRSSKDVLIVLLNVDDPNGGLLAEKLMPNYDWDQYRLLGQVPFARGLATREGIQEFLDILDKDAGDKLRAIPGVAVLVLDFGVAEVYDLGPVPEAPATIWDRLNETPE